MWKLLFVLFAVSPLLLFAQKTRKIVRVYPNSSNVETYHVLKSDTLIKHGKYKYEMNGYLHNTGFYKMGKRDSIWTWYTGERKILEKGWYHNDKRDSIWEYFTYQGKLEQKIDFRHSEVLYYQTTFAKQPFRVITKTDTLMSILDRPPLYIGGMSRFYNWVLFKLQLPLHKPSEIVTGTVFVTFTIDSTGAVSNYRILKGIGKACDEEALRVVRLIPDKWMPGVLNDKFVTVDCIVKIPFDPSFPYSNKPAPPQRNYNSFSGGYEFEEVRF
jgi:protein TonB